MNSLRSFAQRLALARSRALCRGVAGDLEHELLVAARAGPAAHRPTSPAQALDHVKPPSMRSPGWPRRVGDALAARGGQLVLDGVEVLEEVATESMRARDVGVGADLRSAPRAPRRAVEHGGDLQPWPAPELLGQLGGSSAGGSPAKRW